MQVCNKNPVTGELGGSKIITFNNIFSMGDVCLTRADEEKLVPPLYYFAPILANNLVAIEKDTQAELLKIERRLCTLTIEYID